MKVQGRRNRVSVARLAPGAGKRTLKLVYTMHGESRIQEGAKEVTTMSHRNVSRYSEICGGSVISFILRETGDRLLEQLL